MGEYKQNILNVSSVHYSEIEEFTLKNELQPLIQIGDVTGTLQQKLEFLKTKNTCDIQDCCSES